MNTKEYLAEAKKALGIESDYALAGHLDVTRSYMSKLQANKTYLSDEMAIRIAEIVGKNPVLVLADLHAEREKNPAVRAVWSALADKLSTGFNTLIETAIPRGIRLSA